jgi:hypothetical protein
VRAEALLADPLLWEEAPPGIEDAVVAAIAAERAAGGPDAADDLAIRRTARSRRVAGRGWSRPFVAGAAAAAAAVLLVVGVVSLTATDEGSDGNGVEVALAGTDLAPGAAAVADVADTPQGTRIVLDVAGLAAAPDGTYYQAWLREDADDGDSVSAGTFHLRGGDGVIELWAGVTLEDYPVLTVTLQDESGGPESSGEVVLRGAAAEG